MARSYAGVYWDGGATFAGRMVKWCRSGLPEPIAATSSLTSELRLSRREGLREGLRVGGVRGLVVALVPGKCWGVGRRRRGRRGIEPCLGT